MHVNADEFLVTLGQIEDALDKANDPHDETGQAERQQGNQQHDEALFGVTEDEFVNAEGAQQDATDTGGDLFVVTAPRRKLKFFDRLFQHDIEYVFEQLPCSILIVKPGIN